MAITMSAYQLMETDLAHVRLDEVLPHLPGTGGLDILLEGMKALFWGLVLPRLVYDHRLEERSR